MTRLLRIISQASINDFVCILFGRKLTIMSANSGVYCQSTQFLRVISPDLPALWVTGMSAMTHQSFLNFSRLPSSLIMRFEHQDDQDRLTDMQVDMIFDALSGHSAQTLYLCYQPVDIGFISDLISQRPAEISIGFTGMVKRMQLHAKRIERVKQRVQVQFDQIQSSLRYRQALVESPLNLCGLVYLAECDTFQLYDPVLDQFVSLSIPD